MGLLCKIAKQYLVLYDKQMIECRGKDGVKSTWDVGAKDLELIENCKTKLILFLC